MKGVTAAVDEEDERLKEEKNNPGGFGRAFWPVSKEKNSIRVRGCVGEKK